MGWVEMVSDRLWGEGHLCLSQVLETYLRFRGRRYDRQRQVLWRHVCYAKFCQVGHPAPTPECWVHLTSGSDIA